jgi:hypothetical protein
MFFLKTILESIAKKKVEMKEERDIDRKKKR